MTTAACWVLLTSFYLPSAARMLTCLFLLCCKRPVSLLHADLSLSNYCYMLTCLFLLCFKRLFLSNYCCMLLLANYIRRGVAQEYGVDHFWCGLALQAAASSDSMRRPVVLQTRVRFPCEHPSGDPSTECQRWRNLSWARYLTIAAYWLVTA
jgi:hypothetical protein